MSGGAGEGGDEQPADPSPQPSPPRGEGVKNAERDTSRFASTLDYSCSLPPSPPRREGVKSAERDTGRFLSTVDYSCSLPPSPLGGEGWGEGLGRPR